ncbi:uncharacterized protein LOC134902137 [Pseudophryne corroboree]|uniref:uncharacterized protein LOC134902137 n=1 Tax=Pseudophryne corroboree TaxID=495146 RepID=UPI003081F049
MITPGKEDLRHQQQQQFARRIVSLSNSVPKPLPGGVHLKGNTHLDSWLEINHFRCPRRDDIKPAQEHHIPARPTVHRITVDLRPILSQVTDECEVDISDTNSKVSSASTSELSEKQMKRKNESVETQSPPQRNTGAIRLSLPSISNCKTLNEQSRPVEIDKRRASLVAVTDEGTLTCNPEHNPNDSLLVAFPKVILKQIPPQMNVKEQRPLQNQINTFWVDVEKLQLPMSELVKVVKERTDSGQHTMIAQVLCSLRERQKNAIRQDVGVLRRTCQETLQKTPHEGGGVRLTWMKRS